MIDLANNQLTSFNPSQPLPTILLRDLYISGNHLNTNEVNTALILLNTTYTENIYKNFYLQGMNPSAPPSGLGQTAKSGMQAKGYWVLTD